MDLTRLKLHQGEWTRTPLLVIDNSLARRCGEGTTPSVLTPAMPLVPHMCRDWFTDSNSKTMWEDESNMALST